MSDINNDPDVSWHSAKKLETPSCHEFVEMNIIHECLLEAAAAFGLYYDRLRLGDAETAAEKTIRKALFRDGLIQFMACFHTTPRLRGRYLVPAEAFSSVNGWEEAFSWLYDLRNNYAAHIHGVSRLGEVAAHFDPETKDVLAIGRLHMTRLPPGLENEEPIKRLCGLAFANVNQRIEQLDNQISEEADGLTLEQKAALGELTLTVSDDLHLGRDEYRKKLGGRSKAPRRRNRQEPPNGSDRPLD